MSDTHKVFVSFHHADQRYKDEFVRMMGGAIVDRSVHDRDIGDGLKTDTIRQRIRDDFIADATVTRGASRGVHVATQARRLGDRVQFEGHEKKFPVRPAGNSASDPSEL